MKLLQAHILQLVAKYTHYNCDRRQGHNSFVSFTFDVFIAFIYICVYIFTFYRLTSGKFFLTGRCLAPVLLPP